MAFIKNIGNLPPEFRKTERNQQSAIDKTAAERYRATTEGEKTPTTQQDQVNLSSTAQTLLQRDAEIQKYSAEMPFVETLSAEEREEIESKIASGFYASPEVTDEVAGKIAVEIAKNEKPENPGITSAKFQEVVGKIRAGSYESEDVLNVISERILRDL